MNNPFSLSFKTDRKPFFNPLINPIILFLKKIIFSFFDVSKNLRSTINEVIAKN